MSRKEYDKKHEKPVDMTEKEQKNGSLNEVTDNTANNAAAGDKMETENQPGVETEEKTESAGGSQDDKEEKLKEMQDKYLRLSAEFDNYRKRTLKEKMDLVKYASEDVLKDLLPVIDDLDRALVNINEASEIEALRKGIELIHNKFKDFLSQKGVKEIEALHQDFNADLHDAVTKIPVEEEKLKGKNVDVIQKGYYLHDKIIRHSKVVVGE